MANEKQLTARGVAESGVTLKMVECAEIILKELGITRISKKYSTRDVLYEVLRVAKLAPSVDDSVIRDEEEWSQFFEKCKVLVKDPVVGKGILKTATESTEVFSEVVESITLYKGIVVPLERYPGIKLFGRKGKSKAEGRDESIR